jgi:hypothetical protein
MLCVVCVRSSSSIQNPNRCVAGHCGGAGLIESRTETVSKVGVNLARAPEILASDFRDRDGSFGHNPTSHSFHFHDNGVQQQFYR